MRISQETVIVEELPLPVLHKKTSHSSIWETKYDLRDEATMVKFKKYLLAEVDETRSTLPLAGYCFMTGVMCVRYSPFTAYLTLFSFSNALIFSAIFIWCGSQTGNTVQV